MTVDEHRYRPKHHYDDQKKAVKFFAKYASKWHSYANDYDTKDVIYKLAKLGILEVNEYQQAKLKNRAKAEQFLALA